MEKIKKIDIHAHATSWPRRYRMPFPNSSDYLPTAEEIIPMLDEAGIEKTVLLCLCSSEAQNMLITSEDVYNLYLNHKDRFYWFCGIDPRMVSNSENADLSSLIMHYKNLGAKGVGELTANLYTDEPLMDNLFYHCQQCDMPVIIHISPPSRAAGRATGHYGIIDDLGLPRLEMILRKYPGLKILGHSQAFWSEISSDITEERRNSYVSGRVKESRIQKLMRDYGNLYCDLSAGSGLNAMARDKEHAVRFLTEFADRVMFGTDICAPTNTRHTDISNFYDGLYNDGLISGEIYRKICRDNAIRILKLE